MIVLLVVAAVVVGAPVGAAVLVTVASHREDAASTLAGRPPGPPSRLDAGTGGRICGIRPHSPSHAVRTLTARDVSAQAHESWPG